MEGRLYLVEKLYPDLIIPGTMSSQEVNVCTECGIVYVWKPHKLGQCPLKHDQVRPNKEKD